MASDRWTDPPRPKILGHRGFPSRTRENTPESFHMAMDVGADGVELDVHVTADGVPVVHHDPTALCDQGVITLARSSWDTVRNSSFRASEGMYTISGLDGILRDLDGRGLINVEVKPPPADAGAAWAQAVVAALAGLARPEAVLISCFDLDFLHTLAATETTIGLGYLFSVPGAHHGAETVPELRAIHPRRDLVEAELVTWARDRQLAVACWTVDDAHEAARVNALGVDVIITNRPDYGDRLRHSPMPAG